MTVAAPGSRRRHNLPNIGGNTGGHDDDDPNPAAGVREREILDAQLTQCSRVDTSFTRGAVAALHWLIEGGPGPLTGALPTFITFQEIVYELAAAEAIIYGPPSTGREYARGLEHALLWAERATSGPPIPANNRSRPDNRA